MFGLNQFGEFNRPMEAEGDARYAGQMITDPETGATSYVQPDGSMGASPLSSTQVPSYTGAGDWSKYFTKANEFGRTGFYGTPGSVGLMLADAAKRAGVSDYDFNAAAAKAAPGYGWALPGASGWQLGANEEQIYRNILQNTDDPRLQALANERSQESYNTGAQAGIQRDIDLAARNAANKDDMLGTIAKIGVTAALAYFGAPAVMEALGSVGAGAGGAFGATEGLGMAGSFDALSAGAVPLTGVGAAEAGSALGPLTYTPAPGSADAARFLAENPELASQYGTATTYQSGALSPLQAALSDPVGAAKYAYSAYSSLDPLSRAAINVGLNEAMAPDAQAISGMPVQRGGLGGYGGTSQGRFAEVPWLPFAPTSFVVGRKRDLASQLTPDLRQLLEERGIQMADGGHLDESSETTSKSSDTTSDLLDWTKRLANPSTQSDPFAMAKEFMALDQKNAMRYPTVRPTILTVDKRNVAQSQISPLRQMRETIHGRGSFSGLAKGGLPKEYQEASPDGHNPEFVTGLTGYYADGRGTGQSDDIPALLHDGDYVMDAETVSALGDGSSKAGRNVLEGFQRQVPHEAKGGGKVVPAKIADGEYVFPAAFVTALGRGDNKKGAEILDGLREKLRAHKRAAPLSKIPPKAKSPLEYIGMDKR